MEMSLTLCLLTLVFCTAPGESCDYHIFNHEIQSCLSIFNESMETSGYDQNCPWPTTKHIYNVLKECVDTFASMTRCKGFPADEVYLDVHRNYFSLCILLRDPPLWTLYMMIAPTVVFTLLLPTLCVKLTTKESDRVL